MPVWKTHVIQFFPCFIHWGCDMSDGRAWVRTQETGSWNTAFVSYCLENWVLSNDRAWTDSYSCAPFTILWPSAIVNLVDSM